MQMFPTFSLSSRAQRTLAAAGAALALAGCASTPPSASAPTGAPLQTAATHAYHGRFAVQYDDRLGKQ
ncbi:TPA: lipoprotein localization protein LolB, partial [Burkholderia cepacia]|nr:lipoprotein localization protein LolB [Burkholderia cepacia]